MAPVVFGAPALAGNVSVVVTELKDGISPRLAGNAVVAFVVFFVVPETVVSTAVLMATALAVAAPELITRTVNT